MKISSDYMERFICKKNKISADILKRSNAIGSLLLNAAQFINWIRIDWAIQWRNEEARKTGREGKGSFQKGPATNPQFVTYSPDF